MDAKELKRLKRIIINSYDVQIITGRKNKGANALLKKIRKSLNKSDESLVTIDEFCIYSGIDKEDIIHLLSD
jgi:hypothetical protein